MTSQHYKDVLEYCNNIKKGKLISGVYCKKAINRFLSDLKRQKDEDLCIYLMKISL
jgi:hypothetical protein